MQENVLLQQVCTAIHALYDGGAQATEAHQYLSQFQNSKESWTICDQIIGVHADSLACYFAAQTMRSKIKKNFKELPADSLVPLRDSLVNHLSRHGLAAHDKQTEATTTQLCLALADLYIQVPTWKNWIFELLNQCNSLSGDRTMMLLTLLKVFPEEVENLGGVGENRRKAVRAEISMCSNDIINFLTHVLNENMSNEEVVKKIMNCLDANLRNALFMTKTFAGSPLLDAIFHILATSTLSSSLHEAATDALVAATVRAEETTLHLELAKELQLKVPQLSHAFNTAVETEDFDRLNNFARIFVELNEAFVRRIVQQATTSPAVIGNFSCLELLLLVAGHHDYSLIEMTYTIWYRISEELFQYDDESHIDKFKSYVERFIMAVYRHCRINSEETELIDPKSDYGDFRLKSIEALKDVVYMIKTDSCVVSMFNILKEASQRPNATWDESEAALFVIAAVVTNLYPDEDGVMPELMASILSLPMTSHPEMIKTCIHLIADSNEWLERNSQYLDPLCNWIMQFVRDSRFSEYVAEALEKISTRCAPHMRGLVNNLNSLIPQLEGTTKNGVGIEKAINSLLKSIALIISKFPPAEMKMGYEQLCEPVLLNLNKAIEMTNEHRQLSIITETNKENETTSQAWSRLAHQPILWIDRVSSIFRESWKPPPDYQEPVPWYSVSVKLFEILIKAMRKFEGNTRVIEHSCRSIRFLIRSLGIQSVTFVEPLVTTMLDIYSRHHHSSFLYISSILVDEYGAVASLKPFLTNMLVTFTTTTLPLFRQPGGFVNNPDTVDDLFRLSQRFVHRAPSEFFLNPISVVIIECGIEALQLEHQDANRSVTRFFVEVMDQLMKAKKANYSDESVVAANNSLQQFGGKIVYSALSSALFKVTGVLSRDMAEIMAMMARFDKPVLERWLREAVVALPNEQQKATPQQLQAFVTACLGENETSTYAIYTEIKGLVKLFS